ncbi:MAG TPA: glutamine--fructose-6-phosphate transaminase (isomerizing) [Galbitalea sp.]|jgi:glucosamine--fructose-6-phosphate aminotransferase (isomerizing)
MCGIVACRTSGSATDFLFSSLEALEYRGYDSVGIGVQTVDNGALRLRSTHRVAELAQRMATGKYPELTGNGIGHTRWATHGGVTQRNAHPHADCTGSVLVAHNGIIENCDELRELLLERGHEFASDVDSEVIAHLVEDELQAGADLADALRHAIDLTTGSGAIVVMDSYSGRIVGASRRAPLVVATSPEGSFLASDISVFGSLVVSFQVLRDGDVVELAVPLKWTGPHPDAPAMIAHEWTEAEVGLHGYPDHMAKEIDEQPELAGRILDRVAAGASNGTLWRSLELPQFDRVAIVGCGTSLNAGGIIAAAFRRFGMMPAETIIASEAADAVLGPRTLVLAMSQSGETADILSALEGPNFANLSVLAITNNAHSSLARRANAIVECNAGHEVGVAATKTFVAQVLTGVAVAISALGEMDRIDAPSRQLILDDLRRMPDLLAQSLTVSKHVVPQLAAEIASAPGVIFLGRGAGVVYAAEGALKLKELTYRWAEAYPAGELKHGPLALVEDGTPVVVVDGGGTRIASNIAEVSARGARLITIGGAGSIIPALGLSLQAPVDNGFQPCGPLESVIPMQVLARELALVLGRDVDKPRNLAKSVTVE